MEHTAPMDIVDLSPEENARRLRPPLPAKTADVPMIGGRENGAVARLAAEIRRAEQERELLTNPAWLDVLSEDERKAERAVAEKIRAAERAERSNAGMAQVARDRRNRKHGDQLSLITEKL